MRRRDFITLVGGAAAAWPLAARAQQPPMPLIGFLRSTEQNGTEQLVSAFLQGLNESGYVERQNVAIEYRWGNDDAARLPDLAADLVGRQVAVIVANGVAVKPAMAATTTIPIVFVIGIDPVRSGLVSSLNRPGGNVTGVSILTTEDLHAKRLEILHALVPQTTVVAALLDPNVVESEILASSIEAAARAIGLRIVIVKAGDQHKFDAAFSAIGKFGAGALLVGGGALFVTHRRQIVDLAARQALPAIYMTRDSVDVGGLISYGPSQRDAYRRAGVYVGRILHGAKAAELPVELPTKYELVINHKTARALGLTIPSSLLVTADEVIE